MHATAVAFTLFFWVPSLCQAIFPVVGRSHNDDTITNTGVATHPPSSSPWSSQPNTSGNTPQSDEEEKWSSSATNSLDVLIAAFFLIAATWLVLALIYSILVLIVVRMRARGHLDVYDETFGRFYLGSRYYIPFGCVLRRYVIAMNQERSSDGEPVTVRLMTREERRMAMERLLDADHGQQENTDAPETNDSSVEESKEESYINESTIDQPEECDIAENHATDDGTEEEPVCTICLTEYEPADVCFTSSVCSHEFHRTCILEWLERRANTECPCCRTPLVTDEQVWETVQEMREERRRQIRKANRGGFFSRFRRSSRRDLSVTEGEDETVLPTPPTSPTALTSFGSGDETQSESNDDVYGRNEIVSMNLESTQTRSDSDLEAGRRLTFDE